MSMNVINTRWSSEVVTAGSNWLSADVSVGGGTAAVHIIQYNMASANQVKIVAVKAGVTQTYIIPGTSATSDPFGAYPLIVVPGMTYNIQHTGGTHIVNVVILEDTDNPHVAIR